MAEIITMKAMPFDANELIDESTGETYYDRVAYSQDFADLVSTFFSNGIAVRNAEVLGTELEVEHSSGLDILVNKGALIINGRVGWLEEDTTITLSAGGAQARIDRVVAELNLPNDRGIYLKVLEGTPAATPEAPALTQNEDVYQIPLAQVSIAALAATINGIVDERADYIANVMIGVQPPLRPTGDSADNISVTDETAALYGHTNTPTDPLTVDTVLARLYNTESAMSNPSYLAFVGNVNANQLDAAFGKNNVENMHGLGMALAMYAKWKNPMIDIEAEFPNLIQCDNLWDIVGYKLETVHGQSLVGVSLTDTFALVVTQDMIDGNDGLFLDYVVTNGTLKFNTSTLVNNTTGSNFLIVNLATYGITAPGTYNIVLSTNATAGAQAYYHLQRKAVYASAISGGNS